MKRNYSEYICDHCGDAIHVLCNYKGQKPADEIVTQTYGWVIKGKRHFCSEECYLNHKNRKRNYDEFL